MLHLVQTVYDNNVIRFGQVYCNNKNSGAVNGMLKSGEIDSSCIQSQEVWSGTTYALAALMIQTSKISNKKRKEELFKMGMHTAKGIFSAGWNTYGFSFATPEAWDKEGGVRSLGYMRPLCIWSMVAAFEEDIMSSI